jgi:peroxiredoxin
MLLKAELERFRATFMQTAPADLREAMARADLDLAASGLVERARKAGDAAPDFVLPEARGGVLRLSTLAAQGPVVLSFYRGGWCPYCRLELSALQQVWPQMQACGASLVAISPQTPAEAIGMAHHDGLTFPLLSDAGNAVATAFGLVFDLAEELRPIYARFGHALPDRNGDASWRLPIPATYVVDEDRTIALAFLDVDYRHRLEPSEIVAAVAALGAAR